MQPTGWYLSSPAIVTSSQLHNTQGTGNKEYIHKKCSCHGQDG